MTRSFRETEEHRPIEREQEILSQVCHGGSVATPVPEERPRSVEKGLYLYFPTLFPTGSTQTIVHPDTYRHLDSHVGTHTVKGACRLFTERDGDTPTLGHTRLDLVQGPVYREGHTDTVTLLRHRPIQPHIDPHEHRGYILVSRDLWQGHIDTGRCTTGQRFSLRRTETRSETPVGPSHPKCVHGRLETPEGWGVRPRTMVYPRHRPAEGTRPVVPPA